MVREDKPYRWKCHACRQRKVVPVTIDYAASIDHDGRTYEIRISDLNAPRCENCGNIVAIDDVNDRITAALRSAVGLLTPEEIKGHRQRLGYHQQDFAEALGVAVATVSRWENGGQIQQRFHNDVMKAFFALPSCAPSSTNSTASRRDKGVADGRARYIHSLMRSRKRGGSLASSRRRTSFG